LKELYNIMGKTRSSKAAKAQAKAPAKPASVEEFKKMNKNQMAEMYAKLLSEAENAKKAAGAVVRSIDYGRFACRQY